MSVALIIAAYNAGMTIERALASALAEPEVSQVIVVDDASSDDTVIKAQSMDDDSGRLIIVRQAVNCGPSAARNRALGHVTADWIGILDADDFILPGRTARLLRFSGDADFIADDIWQVDENTIEGSRKLLLGLGESRLVDFDEFVLSNVTLSKRQRGEMGFIKPLMRRDFLMRHSLRYRENLRLGEDFALYAQALAFGARLILTPAQGYVSVIRATSLSSQHSAADLLALRDSDKALARTVALTHTNRDALRRHYKSIDCRLQWRLLIVAIKTHNAKQALAAFLRPFPVPIYLLQRLVEQLFIRALKK